MQKDAIHSDSEAEPHPVNTGKRPLRSRKTLFMTQTPDDRTLKSSTTNEDNSQIDPNILKQQFHRDEIQAQEIFLRPRLPGQTTDEKILPTRYHFEYIYTNIHDPELYDYVENLEKWVKFNIKHQLYPDRSKPILDLQGAESTETEFSLTTLLVLNKDLINKKLKEIKKLHKQQSDSLKPGYAKKKALSTYSDSQQPQTSTQADDRTNIQSSGSSSDSFVVIDSITKPTETLISSSLDKETGTRIATGDNSKSTCNPESQHNPSRTSSLLHSLFDSDSDSDFDPTATMVDRKIPAFFPPDKFDGQNKTLTKQHWQIFKDFCDQQKLNFEDIPATPDADAIPAQTERILGYFKITLLGIARDWFDRNEFASAKALQDKFLNDFSPYGKTSHQWLQQWNTLSFNPDTDNLDEFLVKFNDLALLVGAPPDFKLMAFRVLMPRDIVIATRNLTTYEECARTARDLMTILQNPLTNKMSALSLMQSRSPSPIPRPRTPSPGPTSRNSADNRQPRSRSRDRGNGRAIFTNSNPRPILKKTLNSRPPRNGSIGRSYFRPQSRPRRSFPRCYNCGILGHVERNCFTRTRFPRNQNTYPRQFTPNMPPKRNRNQSRPRPTVHFSDQNFPPRGRGYRGRGSNYRQPQRIYNPQERSSQRDFQTNDSDYSQNYNYTDDYYQPQYQLTQQSNTDSIHLTDTFHDTLNQ